MNNEKITHIDLFSGIGGFALATEAVWGKENIEHIFCDNEPFAQAILKKHWPEAKIYGDIRTLTNTESEQADSAKSRGLHTKSGVRSREPFLLTGGFPCQPFSQAGRRKGTEDDRFLWPEMARVIGEFKPTWVIAENVRGLLTINGGVVFEQVCLDLESLGYEVLPFVIPAVAVNAPHRRDRVWFVANRKSGRTRRSERKGSSTRQSEATTGDGDSNAQNTNSERSRGRNNVGRQSTMEEKRSDIQDARPSWQDNWPEVAARLCTLDDELSNGLVRPRGWRNAALKGAGNAIVPQVAEQIMLAIKHSL